MSSEPLLWLYEHIDESHIWCPAEWEFTYKMWKLENGALAHLQSTVVDTSNDPLLWHDGDDGDSGAILDWEIECAFRVLKNGRLAHLQPEPYWSARQGVYRLTKNGKIFVALIWSYGA